MHRHLLGILLAFGLAASSVLASGQNRTHAPVRLPVGFQQMTTRAGTIFSGRVISIVPIRSHSPGHIATVTITLEVENAVRGVKSGQPYSFREWAGLWSAGPRYRVGERLLLFLYAPSTLGLTSPVGGSSGALPIDAEGKVLLLQQQRILEFSLPPTTRRTSFLVNNLVKALRLRED